MRAKFVNEKFTSESDPIHDMDIGIPFDFLMNLLKNRIKHMKNFNKTHNPDDRYENPRIVNTTVVYDAFFGNDIEDCKFKIIGDRIIFTIQGDEGANDIEFKINEKPDNILKLIKKYARMNDTGGLK